MMSEWNNSGQGRWSTTEFDCIRDQEICWWGTWCCCLLSSRNSGTFRIGSNITQAIVFIVAVFLSIYALLYLNVIIGILVLVISLIAHCMYRVWMRSKISESLNIPSSPVSDIILHCCCPCCLLCQEAREAKLR